MLAPVKDQVKRSVLLGFRLRFCVLTLYVRNSAIARAAKVSQLRAERQLNALMLSYEVEISDM